jgi:HEAT repeat protein
MAQKNPVKIAAIALGAIGVLLLTYLGYTTLIGPRVRSSEAAAVRRSQTLGPKSLERLQNPATRVAEARALGEAKVKPAATILAQFTKDNDPEFRKVCVWAIGNIGVKDGVNALRVRVFDKDVGVRIETAQALGKLYGHVAFKALEDMMTDEEPVVRVAVAKTFATVVAEDKTVIARLAELLKDPVTDVRAAAIRGLARSKEDEATTAMIRALADGDADVRRIAAREIAGRRSEAAYYALGSVLGHADANVRAAAGEAVLQIGKPILPYLKNAITTTPSLEARIEAVRLLAKLGGPDAVPTLVGMLGKLPRDGGGRAVTELRDATIENLVAIGEPAIPAMSQEVMIGENSRLAEESVAEVCARIGKAAVPAIVQGITRWKLYHDPVELELWLRTLGRIGDPGALPALNRALSQDLDGMDKVVAEVRQQIETASGQKLPDPKPDPVAFHAPLPAVAALDFPAPPTSPTTKPCGRVPENGVLTLVLWESMFRADAKAMCSANLEVPRKDGA